MAIMLGHIVRVAELIAIIHIRPAVILIVFAGALDAVVKSPPRDLVPRVRSFPRLLSLVGITLISISWRRWSLCQGALSPASHPKHSGYKRKCDLFRFHRS